MRWIFLFFVGVLSGVTLAGCGRPASLPKKAPKLAAGQQPVITVIAGNQATYWNECKLGAQDAGKKLGANIKWQAPGGKDLAKEQNELIKEASEDSQGIVVAPADPTRLVRGFGNAARDGLVIVAMDHDVYTIQNKLSLVQSDEEMAGALAARKAGKWSGDKLTVGAWIPSPDDHEATARFESFEKTLAGEFPQVKLEKFEPGQTAPQNIEIWFAPDGATGKPYLGGSHSSRRIVVCAVGEEWMQALQKEAITVLISPDYHAIGYESVKAILDYRALKDPPKSIQLPPVVMTKKFDKAQRHKSLA